MSLKVKDDWKFVAMVMDRMFLWIFTLAVLGIHCHHISDVKVHLFKIHPFKMPSWHGWDNTPGADIVWRPPSNRRTPFRDRGGDLHKASGFQWASRTIWHRVRKKTETNGRTKLLLRLVSQNSNSSLGLYDILWTGKRPKHEQTSIILMPKKLENKKDRKNEKLILPKQ